LVIDSISFMIQPSALKKGDTLAIVAPAGFLKSDTAINKGVALTESWGLNVEITPNVFKKQGHFAGTDAERLSDLQWALNNPTVKAIWCARGGYGTNRIIDALDFTKFLQNPKWLIGYSDITILLNHINNLGVMSLHAMMATSLSSFKNKLAVSSLKNALFDENLSYTIPSNKYNVFGQAEGILVGGNLSLLASLLGTESAIKQKDFIFFIEEIGEYKYHIDRMLYSLKRNGYFKNCKGLLVGGMTDIPVNDPLFGKSIEQLVLDILGDVNIPICFDVPAGHIDKNCALILGKPIKVIVADKKSQLIFN